MRTERSKLAAKLLEEMPNESQRRVAMVLHSQRPDLFSTVEKARSAVRYVIGTRGNGVKKWAIKENDIEQREGSRTYAMPKSKAKPWLPYEIKGPVTVAVLSDIHFPKHSELALTNAVEYIKSRGEIDVVVLNGDIADAEEFGSWAKSPKAIQTEDSVQCVRDGLLWVLSQFPNAKIIYKFGNHEERLDRYCWSRAPELVGMPHITWEGLLTIGQDLRPIPEFERIEWVKDQRPVMAGKLPILHGHELPKALVNSVNPARGAFLRMIDTVLIGHHHRSSSHVEYNWMHEPINCWSVGCLCDLNPEYFRINKWNHGGAIVDVAANSDFDVHNFKLMKNGEAVGA
jgi:predicted phosphodiesterase